MTTRLAFYEAELSIEGGSSAARELPMSGRAVSAILCLSDVLAMGALFELQHACIEVPRDLSLMGIDDLSGSRFSAPPLTTVRLPVQEMGVEAAAALAAWVGQDQVPKPQALKSELVVRQSTAVRR